MRHFFPLSVQPRKMVGGVVVVGGGGGGVVVVDDLGLHCFF